MFLPIFICSFLLVDLNRALTFDEVILKIDRFSGQFLNKRNCDGNVTCAKHNRTHVLLNYNFLQKVTINRGDIATHIKMYQFLSNTYRLTAFQFQVDYCDLISGKKFGFGQGLRNGLSNFPENCPVTPALYYMRNVFISLKANDWMKSIPSNFVGKWKINVEFFRPKERNSKESTLNIFMEIVRVPKW